MGRPRLDNAKRVHIPLKVSEQMAARIDTARGSASRADWIRGLVDAALSGAREPGPPARAERAGEAAAGEPGGDHAGHRVSPAWGTARTGRYHCETCRAWVTGPQA